MTRPPFRCPARCASVVTLFTLICACASLPAQEQERKPDEQRAGSDSAPVPPTLPVGQSTPSNEQHKASEPTNPWIDWLASNGPADYALLVVGALTAWAAIRSLKAIETQVEAAIGATNAAKRSADIADLSLKTIQRPFVAVRGWSPPQWRCNIGPHGNLVDIVYPISPVLMNSGVTPTHQATLVVNCLFSESKLPKGFVFTYRDTPKPVVIGPKAELRSASLALPAEQLKRVQSRSGEFYVWGEVAYRDQFPDTPIHYSRFCYKVTEVVGDPLNPKTPTNPNGTDVWFTMFMHPDYNEAT